jgi:hypothetical protein
LLRILFRKVRRSDIESGAIGSDAIGSLSGEKITYGTIGSVKISGARITHGTIVPFSNRIGSLTAEKITYGTIGSAKIAGERITHGTIVPFSNRIGSLDAAKITYGTIGLAKIAGERITYGTISNLRLRTIVQDGTCTLALGSTYVSFPTAFAASPRAVCLTPMAEAGEVYYRVVRISAGSFAALGTPGGKNYYYMAKGSRA